jgi:hypothetical protein
MDNFERNGSNQIKKIKVNNSMKKSKKVHYYYKKKRGQKVGVITV